MPPKTRKALKIEPFEPDEDILETTCKWKLWRRRLEVQMKYFDIVKPEDIKAALLVHGGDKILSIDENSAQPQEDLDEYKTLIAKIEHIYVARNTRLMRDSDSIKLSDNQINPSLNTNLNFEDLLKNVTFMVTMTRCF